MHVDQVHLQVKDDFKTKQKKVNEITKNEIQMWSQEATGFFPSTFPSRNTSYQNTVETRRNSSQVKEERGFNI